MTAVMRAPGHYAVVDGVEVPVSASGYDHVWIDGVRHEMDDLDDLLLVSVSARWHGADIAVGDVQDGRVRFYTWDRDLAEREGLTGDVRDGWRGLAPVSEVTDVAEKVSSIHPRRREA
jgi:hypothetical protein